jgi:hypothetical protein
VDKDDGAEGAERGSGGLLVCERDQSGTSDEKKQEITHQVPSTMRVPCCFIIMITLRASVLVMRITNIDGNV